MARGKKHADAKEWRRAKKAYEEALDAVGGRVVVALDSSPDDRRVAADTALEKANELSLRDPYAGMEVSRPDGWSNSLLTTEVAADSPAAAAGLMKGDIIIAFNRNGQAEWIDSTRQFLKILGGHKVGDTVELAIRRGSEMKRITITLGERP
jgi:S1-C subfamily serine protease